MRVAVVGASGRSGQAVAARAVRAGHEVVAIVRTPGSAPAGTIEKIAEARDEAALAGALRQADAVISCLGHNRAPGGPKDPTILHDGVAALLSAMAATRVRRLVAISAAGAYVQGDDPLSRFIAKPIVERFFGEPYDDTRQFEKVIRASGTDWTILRPSRLIPGAGRPSYRFGIDTAVRWHYSTTFNTVGRAAVDALAAPAWVEHAVFITE